MCNDKMKLPAYAVIVFPLDFQWGYTVKLNNQDLDDDFGDHLLASVSSLTILQS